MRRSDSSIGSGSIAVDRAWPDAVPTALVGVKVGSTAGRGNLATSRRSGSAYDRRMIETALLNLVRRHWWLLALMGYAAWTIESVFAGNSASEIITASLMVCVWATAIFVIDRWIVKSANRKEPHG
jgi:hypothetical protein